MNRNAILILPLIAASAIVDTVAYIIPKHLESLVSQGIQGNQPYTHDNAPANGAAGNPGSSGGMGGGPELTAQGGNGGTAVGQGGSGGSAYLLFFAGLGYGLPGQST